MESSVHESGDSPTRAGSPDDKVAGLQSTRATARKKQTKPTEPYGQASATPAAAMSLEAELASLLPAGRRAQSALAEPASQTAYPSRSG
jgi:hypothetical protein